MSMSPQANENRNKIADIRQRLLQGEITYEQARTEAEPILTQMNAVGARIARESGMKFKPLTFAYLIR